MSHSDPVDSGTGIFALLSFGLSMFITYLATNIPASTVESLNQTILALGITLTLITTIASTVVLAVIFLHGVE